MVSRRMSSRAMGKKHGRTPTLDTCLKSRLEGPYLVRTRIILHQLCRSLSFSDPIVYASVTIIYPMRNATIFTICSGHAKAPRRVMVPSRGFRSTLSLNKAPRIIALPMSASKIPGSSAGGPHVVSSEADALMLSVILLHTCYMIHMHCIAK